MCIIYIYMHITLYIILYIILYYIILYHIYIVYAHTMDGELFWDFFLRFGIFLDSVLRGVLFACSMAPTGVFFGFHSFSRVLNVFWVFSLLFTGFFGFERFCFVLAVFGRVSRDLHTCNH